LAGVFADHGCDGFDFGQQFVTQRGKVTHQSPRSFCLFA
jgi:hypothetical protein